MGLNRDYDARPEMTMTEQKRGRGRPPKEGADIELTMLVLKRIESASGLTPADLESQLLPEVGGDPQPGARWNRYARGDRSMNPSRLEELYQKAIKAGYLPKHTGFRTAEFGHLSLGRSVIEMKTTMLLANSRDRALVKQVAEVRSKLRALRSTLNALGEGYWDSANEQDEQNYYRQSEVLKKIDTFDETLSSLRFNSLYFDPHIKEGK